MLQCNGVWDNKICKLRDGSEELRYSVKVHDGDTENTIKNCHKEGTDMD